MRLRDSVFFFKSFKFLILSFFVKTKIISFLEISSRSFIIDKSIGFNSSNNEVSIVQKGHEIEKITKRDKSEIASIIVQKILKKFSINENQSLN